MEAVVFVGIQTTGKSTFYHHQFGRTHMHINLDMLKTRHREQQFLSNCLETRQRFVVDNINPTPVERLYPACSATGLLYRWVLL